MSLSVDIEKRLGDFHLKVCFDAHPGVLALLGASGSGKSMTLKCIAGIEKPDRGRIVLDGRVLFDSEQKIDLPPQKRKVGYLFQEYALFPHMTVEQNIRTGLRTNNTALLRQVVRALGLEGTEQLRPHQLSGGQQQRVALARILVNEPDVLLLDEPFSSLDQHLRFRLEQELRRVIGSFGKPVLLVSHQREEVFRLSQHTAILHRGTLQAVGETKEVFRHPRTETGARLVGCENISPIEKISEHRILATDWGLELDTEAPVGNARFVAIRSFSPEGKENRFSFQVTDVLENPDSTTVVLNNGSLVWKTEKCLWQKGDCVTLSVPKEELLLLR